MLKYCKKCIMPHTKPDLSFDKDGICSACKFYEERKSINWELRKKELEKIFSKYRRANGDNWDCIVPVSGGKDSTFQVLKVLEFGMNPLCVTSTTCNLSKIGRKNIENIKKLGVDYVEVSPNPIIRAKLNTIGLKTIGDISWPEHVAMFTIPVRAAVQYNVPLVIWGENSQNEYGGPASAAKDNVLNRRWLEEFGGLLGLRVSDMIGREGIHKKDMIPYFYPTDEDLKRVKVTGLFLGYYLPWDGLTNFLLAQANGFHAYEKTVEGSMVNYENLDNHQTGIHDYFKFLKFGFGRATDIACLHIRRGRISRNDGLAIAKKNDGHFPWEYLGKTIAEILKPLQISVDEFEEICDEFTNKKIFMRDNQGKLMKDNNRNLTKINYDNQ